MKQFLENAPPSCVLRQHTLEHTLAYVSIRESSTLEMLLRKRAYTLQYISIRQHTSAYLGIRHIYIYINT